MRITDVNPVGLGCVALEVLGIFFGLLNLGSDLNVFSFSFRGSGIVFKGELTFQNVITKNV